MYIYTGSVLESMKIENQQEVKIICRRERRELPDVMVHEMVCVLVVVLVDV